MSDASWKEAEGIDWVGLRNRPLASGERRSLRSFYSSRYHENSVYTVSDPLHELIHRRRAELLLAVFPEPGKVLDAGCSAGGTVRALRQLGVDAWGFDVCPDLHDMAYEEVRAQLRIGDFDAIPYSAVDGFRTLVSYDVFEHVPIDVIQQFPLRLEALGVVQGCCLISKDTLTVDHITIQDSDWYRQQFAAAGYRVMDEITEDLRSILWPVPSVRLGAQPLHLPFEWTGEPRN